MPGAVPVRLLEGIKVCLCAHYIPGPLAANLLQALGAEIIKVEPPNYDLIRMFPPYFQRGQKNMGAWFRALNGGFQSMVLDFKQAEGIRAFARLLDRCDVLIDGNRPGFLSGRLQVDIAQRFPNLVYLPISAYGQHGPLRNVAGHDGNILALAGSLSYTSSAAGGLPALFSAPVVDILSAHTAALCAVAGVAGRDRGAAGPRVFDVSMLHNAMSLNQLQIAGMNLHPAPPVHDQAWMNGGLPNYTVYATADGQAVFFGPIEEHLFQLFSKAVNRDDLPALLYADNAKLSQELKLLFQSRTRSEWEDVLDGVDCCFSVVNNLGDAQTHPQVQALGLIQTVEDHDFGPISLTAFPAGFGPDSNPALLPQDAPEPGQHTQEILRVLLGYSDGEILDMLASGAAKARK